MKCSQVTVLLLCVAALSKGAEIAEVVRDGVSRTLPCSSSDGRPYRWSWCRVNRLDQCEPIPLEVGTDGQSLHRTFYTNSTTGVYSCVAKDDESTVFDTYYQLSADEWLHISPDQLVISHGETPTLTILLRLLKRQLKEVKVYYRYRLWNGSVESLLDRIPSIKIKDGVAEYTVNSTSLDDGFIIVKAHFTVNSVSHKVESAVKLSFVQPSTENPSMPATSSNVLSTSSLAVIIVILLGVVLVPSLVVVASFGIWKMRKMQNARIDGARQVGQPPQQVEQAQAAGAARLAELEVGVQEGQQEHDHTAADSGSLYAATEETSRRPEQNGVSGIPTQEVGNLDVWPAGHRGGPYTVGVAVTRDTGGSEII